jgi:hypothetical protein
MAGQLKMLLFYLEYWQELTLRSVTNREVKERALQTTKFSRCKVITRKKNWGGKLPKSQKSVYAHLPESD